MNILFVSPWFPNKENPTLGNFIIRHAKLLQERHKVYVIAYSSIEKSLIESDKESLSDFGLEGYHYLSPKQKASSYFRWWSRAIDDLNDAGFKPDLIHSQILHHSGDFVQFLKRQFKLPVFCTEHWSGHLAERMVKLRTAEKIRLQLSKKNVDVILPVTEQLGRALRENGFQQKIQVWRNPVDTHLFFPQEKKEFDFIHISTLDENKRPDQIIRAFRDVLYEFPHARMSLGGDGPITHLQDLKSELSIPDKALSLHAALSYSQVAERMRLSKCLVQYSQYENLPCTIGEALSSGLRVISSDVGGISELVNSENGRLVQKESFEQLVRAMKNELKESLPSPSFHSLDNEHLLDEIDFIYRQELK